MNFIKVPLKQIRSKSWNPKTPEEYKEEYEQVKKSIYMGKIYDPLMVRELKKDVYEIVDGETRLGIYNEAEIEAVTVNNLGKLSDEDAKSICLLMTKHVPVDYHKETLLVKSVFDKLGEEGLKLFTNETEELKMRLEALNLPKYENLAIVLRDEDAEYMDQKKIDYIRMEEEDKKRLEQDFGKSGNKILFDKFKHLIWPKT